MTGVDEVLQTLRMVEVEHLDIRTVTLGISLLDLDCSAAQLPDRIYDRVTSLAGPLVAVAKQVEEDLGVPIINKRVAVTPVALIGRSDKPEQFVAIAAALDRAAAAVGIDYIAGFSALVHKGLTVADQALIDALPQAIATTARLCGSVNVATTRAGINMDAVLMMGHTVRGIAAATAAKDGIGCARFVVFANAVEDNPFIAGAFHGVGEPQAVLNVGVSGPGVVNSALRRLMAEPPPSGIDLTSVADVIKRMSFKITRAGELIGRVVAKRLGEPVKFGVVDLSLAPTPAEGDSVANILEAMGLEHAGAPGSTAALMLLTDAVKKGGAMATSYVGGLSGAFIPVSEDAGMVEAARVGALTIEKLEAMTAVCSVGLDMVAIPGDTPAETIAAIIADQIAIGVINGKTTAARLLPIPGRRAGDIVSYGGLLGDAIVMPVNTFSCERFMRLGGRIPAPVQSLRN
ncbi:MAG: PFL family protein [Deltaproteobacteria bacterium]|nr:PFL family protein [Deltaproteobacteria bacterium]